jgi:hypothetical protein
MAYPTVNGPYGLKPVNEIGGLPYAGSTRMIPIVSGYASNINFGDVVQINTNNGTLIKTAVADPGATQAAVAGTIGVFVGCEYSSSTGPIYGKNRYQNWVGGTVAADCVAYVVDDPRTVFKVYAVTNTGSATNTTQAALGQVFVGSNLELVTNYSSTAPLNGDSSAAVCTASSGVKLTGAGPFRVVGLVSDTALSVSTTLTVATSATQTPASMTGIYPGMAISGSGVTAGTYVQTVTSTQFVASASFTSVSGATYTFTGAPEVLVTWNQGHHSYTNATGV